MVGMGILAEASGDETSYPSTCAVQRPDQAVDYDPREQLGDAPRSQAPEPSSQGRSQHFAVDQLWPASCEDSQRPRAMQYLDSLYVQTERLIQGRRATIQPTSFGGI